MISKLKPYELHYLIGATTFMICGMALCIWTGSVLFGIFYVVTLILLLIGQETIWPTIRPLDMLILDYQIISAAQNDVEMKCKTCIAFIENRCHRIAPFIDVKETDFCMKYELNPKCKEYLTAFKMRSAELK